MREVSLARAGCELSSLSLGVDSVSPKPFSSVHSWAELLELPLEVLGVSLLLPAGVVSFLLVELLPRSQQASPAGSSGRAFQLPHPHTAQLSSARRGKKGLGRIQFQQGFISGTEGRSGIKIWPCALAQFKSGVSR